MVWKIGRVIGRFYALICCWLPLMWFAHQRMEWYGSLWWLDEFVVLFVGLLGLMGSIVVLRGDR